MSDQAPAQAPSSLATADRADTRLGHTVPAVLDTACAAYADRPAVRFFGKTTTYREFYTRVTQAASVLRRLGAGPGVRLGLLLPASPAVPVYGFAAFAVGATLVPLDPSARDDELGHLILASDVTLLVTCDLASCVAKATTLTRSGKITAVVVLAYAAMLDVVTAARLRLFGSDTFARMPSGFPCRVFLERDLLRDTSIEAVVSSRPTPRPAALDDIAFMSGGTAAGKWRLALLTHANIANNLAQVSVALPTLQPGTERIVAALPLWHPLAFGLAVTLAVAHGAELTIVPDLAVKTLAGVVKAQAPTVILAPAPLFAALVAHSEIGPAAMAAVRFAVVVGGTASAKMHAGMAALSAAPVLECYGIELAPAVIAMTQPGDTATPASGGRVMSGTHITVRDLADHEREVPRGERGELCVKGPQIATPAQLAPSEGAHIGGALRTGDLGSMDPQGRLFVVDRVDDLIVAAGYLIYPRRIEAALLEHPAILDAAVIGISDGRRGHAPKAFVVIKRGEPVTERDLRLFLASRISKIEMPADIDFRTSLPRTPFGLICKATLRRETVA